MKSRSKHLMAVTVAAVVALTSACGSDSDAADMNTAACDAYAAIGAAVFGDPSGVSAEAATLAAESPSELRDAAATYGDAYVDLFEGDDAATESAEFQAAADEIGAAVFAGCDHDAMLDVSGIDYAFEDLPDQIDAGRVAVRFTNNTSMDEQHEMVLVRKLDGVTESAAELLELPEDELMSRIVPTAVVFADGHGVQSVALADLEPGSYIAVCMIPTHGDGPPHAMNGMVGELEVV